MQLQIAGVFNLPYIPSPNGQYPSYFIRFTLNSDDGSQLLLPSSGNGPDIFIDDSGAGTLSPCCHLNWIENAAVGDSPCLQERIEKLESLKPVRMRCCVTLAYSRMTGMVAF